MPEDPYIEHEEDENRLRTLLWGAGGAGILYALSRLPTRLTISGRRISTRTIIQRDPAAIGRSIWWRGLWEGYEGTAADVLARISRRAASPLIRRYATRFGQPIQANVANVAERFAREYAARIARDIEEGTLRGLISSADAIRARNAAAKDLRQQLASRLGPTRRQLEGPRGILTWERRAREAGKLTEAQIRRAVYRRTINAAKLRARIIASDALVTNVSETLVTVATEARLKLSIGNPLDDRTRLSHRRQVVITRSSPVEPGQPWPPGAPFSGTPPYGAGCRCWVETRE